MITMLLGGLWHGASWTFVVWGGLHGVYLAVERFVTETFGKTERMARLARTTLFQVGLALLTYFLINVTWVFFRAQDFPSAWSMMRSMLGLTRDGLVVLPTVNVVETVVVIGAMLVVHWRMRNRSLHEVVSKTPWWVVGIVWGLMLFAIVAAQGSGSAFIYFQF